MNLSSIALITLTTICHLNNQQIPMIHVPRSCRVPFITDTEPVYSWHVLFVQNKQRIYCINNVRWVSFKPIYKRFEPPQNQICLKGVEKVGKQNFSSNHKNRFNWFITFRNELVNSCRAVPTTCVGHQISRVDSRKCGSEESLSHNQTRLLCFIAGFFVMSFACPCLRVQKWFYSLHSFEMVAGQ